MLRLLLVGAALAALVVLACGDDEGGGEVGVALQEFAVLPSVSSIGAGEVTFVAVNEGPESSHELVVIKTDLAPNALPTNPDGSVNEAGAGIEVIGEIEEFPVGESRSASFDLEAGGYVLICNVTEEEDGQVEAHYAEGMLVGFTVTD